MPFVITAAVKNVDMLTFCSRYTGFLGCLSRSHIVKLPYNSGEGHEADRKLLQRSALQLPDLP